MITAVLGDRTLELAAETPYRQAAKEAFRHFGASEGTVKIYAGGQHVKSFRGGAPFGLTNDGWGTKFDGTWAEVGVKIFSCTVASKSGWGGNKSSIRQADQHNTISIYVNIPVDLSFIVIRTHAKTRESSYKMQDYPVGTMIRIDGIDVKDGEDRGTLHIGEHEFSITGSATTKQNELNENISVCNATLNGIFPHKNKLDETTTMSLKVDELPGVSDKSLRTEIVNQFRENMNKDLRYIRNTASKIFTPQETTPHVKDEMGGSSTTFDYVVNFPVTMEVKQEFLSDLTFEEIADTVCITSIPELHPIFAKGDVIQQVDEHNITSTAQLQSLLDNDKHHNITFSHANVELVWTGRDTFKLRHLDLDLEEDDNYQIYGATEKWWSSREDEHRNQHAGLITTLKKMHANYVDHIKRPKQPDGTRRQHPQPQVRNTFTMLKQCIGRTQDAESKVVQVSTYNTFPIYEGKEESPYYQTLPAYQLAARIPHKEIHKYLTKPPEELAKD